MLFLVYVSGVGTHEVLQIAHAVRLILDHSLNIVHDDCLPLAKILANYLPCHKESTNKWPGLGCAAAVHRSQGTKHLRVA